MPHFIENLNKLIQLYSGKYLEMAVKVIFIIICIWLVKTITIKLTQKLFTPKKDSKISWRQLEHGKTLLPLLISIERYVIYFIGVIAILSALGIDTKAIIASAGILGIAVGFGAQNMVKDFISGFFLIFDGLIKIGDVITVGNITGEVETIDLRNTMIREYHGQLWAVPNGDIRTLGNFNRDWVRAIVEVGVAYEQPVAKSLQVLQKIADKWAEANNDIVLEKPVAQGINNLGDSAVIIRIVAKVKPLKHWAAERDLKLLIKDHFDREGVEIPFPRTVIYTRSDDDWKAQQS